MTGDLQTYKISFIIPVLNGEKYIARCLDHIIAEKAPEDEVILVDNGSTDSTLEIARQYDLAHILVRSGCTVAASRNHGAAHASGELLAFIDSDCLICPGWRESVIKTLKEPQIAATGARYSISPDATWVEKAWYSAKSNDIKKVNYINSGNLIVKRTAFNSIDGFNEILSTDEDYDLCTRLRDKDFIILDVAAIKSIHLGNPKTMKGLFKKISWHASGGVKLKTGRFLDKPMIMTMAFIVAWITAILLLPFVIVGRVSPVIIILLIIIVPLLTVIFRIAQFGNYLFALHLVILYEVYYVARSLAFFKNIVGKFNK